MNPEIFEIGAALANVKHDAELWNNSLEFASAGDRVRIEKLARDFDETMVERILRERLSSGPLTFDSIHSVLLREMGENSPKFTHCSAGRTSLDIDAEGNYSRCLRYTPRKQFMGNVLEDGQFNLLDLNKEAECNVRCKLQMCFARNVIRTTSQEDLDHQIETKGIRGDYGDYRGRISNPDAEIFARWKITNVCNYRCSYCSAWRTVNKKLPEIAGQDALRVAEKLVAQFDKIAIRITGGEPSTVKTYVEIMKLLNDNLDRISDLEIRTNFSYPDKHEKVFSWDWKNKLNYHIGAHVYDVSFKPWDWIKLLPGAKGIRYAVKFVRTSVNGKYVDRFRKYLYDNGIPYKMLRVIQDINDKAEACEDVPPAYKTLQEQGVFERD